MSTAKRLAGCGHRREPADVKGSRTVIGANDRAPSIFYTGAKPSEVHENVKYSSKKSSLSLNASACTGDPIAKGMTQAGEDITEARITPAIKRLIAEDGTFSGSISGTLSCVGDPMQCDEFDAGWDLEMPSDMVSTFTAAPGEG